MRIFLSYASDDEDLARQLQLKLRAAGYSVFFSGTDIRASDGYDARIREEIEEADRFLFLASPAALAKGRYTLTELALAETRWPDPAGHVMAVLVNGTTAAELPPWLGAVASAVEPQGNAASHVAAVVTKRWPRRWKRLLKPAALGLLLVALLGGAWHALQGPATEPSTARPRLSPEQFRVELSRWRQAEEEHMAAKAGSLTARLAGGVSLLRVIPRPTTPPPTDLPAEHGARLRRLAAWAYPHGDTPAERVSARKTLLSEAMAFKLAGWTAAQPHVPSADTTWMKEHRAPGSDESLFDWYVRAWTRTLDPEDEFDRWAGDRILTGAANVDPNPAWPPKPTAHLFAHRRIMRASLIGDDEFAQAFVFMAAVAGRLEAEGWLAPHPIGETYDAVQKLAASRVAPLWSLIWADADMVLNAAYKREYEAP